MPPWNWTWEETPSGERSGVLLEARESTLPPRPPAREPQAVPARAEGPPRPPARGGRSGGGGGGGDGPERPNYHRRRVGAAIALGALLIVVVALAASGGGTSSGTHKPGAARAHTRLAGAPARTPSAASSEPTPQAEEQAINRVLAYAPAVVEGGRKGNEVALTFDDGPGPYTPRLVATLNRLHAHATFFAIGEMERYFSEGTRLEVRSGDVVGDHTETHPMLAAMSAHQQREEILEQLLRIELLGGPRPRLFRPPYGSFNETTWRELGAQHLLTVLWSTDTNDYRLPGVQAIVQSALAGAHPGAIILMHDGGGDRSQTIAALPAIVKGLRARGLRPVTVPRLLLDDPPSPGQPIPTSLAGD